MSTGKGLLLVFSEVGDQLSESEYSDWYDNEHIPLRTALPGFLSATRLIQTDGLKPTWGAIYDLSSVDFLQEDAYTALVKMRSEREASVLSRIGLLDRRIYTLNEEALELVSPEFKGYKEGMIVLVVSMDVEPDFEDELNRWYNEEHSEMLSKVPGWLRSRRYYLVDAAASGTLKQQVQEYKQPAKFMAVHEYKDIGPGLFDAEEFKAAISTPWRKKIWENNKNTERRAFKVYKTF
ncbi:hypothetical protein ACEPAG_385 [Sanghuangporus baumii]